MNKVIVSEKKLNNVIRRTVIETIREIFNDPDFGLPLTPYIIRHLQKSLKSKKTGRLISLEEILKKYSK